MTDDRRVLLKGSVLLGAVIGFAISCHGFQSQSARQQLPVIELPDIITAQDYANFQQIINAGPHGPWHDAPCYNCQSNGEVQISAIGRTTDIKAHNGPSRRRAVAVIRNVSGEDVIHGPSKFTFLAHATYLLYIVRGAAPDSEAFWGIARLQVGIVPPHIGKLNECPPHIHTGPKIDDAYFANCGDAHITSKSIHFVHATFSAEQTHLAASIPQLGWISCDPDCCTGAGTYLGPPY